MGLYLIQMGVWCASATAAHLKHSARGLVGERRPSPLVIRR